MHFRKAIEKKHNILAKSLAFLTAFSVIVSGSAYAPATAEELPNQEDLVVVQEEASEEINVTAGAIFATNNFDTTFADMQEEIQAQIENDGEWANRLMADVDEDNPLEIYDGLSEEANPVGLLKSGDVAEFKSLDNGWYQIVSGEIEGYVDANACVTGGAAREKSEVACKTYATSFADGLRIRKGPSTETRILSKIYNGDKLEVNPNPDPMTAEEADGWIPVIYRGKGAYISSMYADVALEYGQATVIGEEEPEEALSDISEIINEPVSASVDDVTLLGALIQCEAGGCPYEGMIAVGAVVLNRMRAGYSDGTMRGVIYQPGQFTPAINGKVDRTIAGGVRGECIQAAKDALAGVDNTGGCLNFRAAWTGHAGNNIGGNVFF